MDAAEAKQWLTDVDAFIPATKRREIANLISLQQMRYDAMDEQLTHTLEQLRKLRSDQERSQR